MSDANLVKLTYAKESSFAQTPDRATRPTSLGFTKASFKKSNDTVVSDTIRGDRQVQELVKVGVGAAGDLDFELVAGDFDPFFVSALQGQVVAIDLPLVAAVIASTTNQILTSNGEDIAVLAGARYLKITGAATAANNGIKKLVSIIGADTIQLAAGSFTTDEPSVTVHAICNYVRNGAVQPLDSYIFEERFISPTAFLAIYGMCVNTLNLDVKSKSKVMGKLTFLGYDGLHDTKSFFGVRAAVTLTLNSQPTNGQTVTIGTKVYTFQTTLTNFDGNVKIGADALGSANNLIAAVNLGTGAGTAYATAMTANAVASAALANVAAKQTLTLTGQPLNTETVVVNGKTYTFQTSLTNADGHVLIGATTAESILNLLAAVNLGTGSGINYAAATTAGVASAAAGAGTTVVFTAKIAGTVGNAYTSTETLTNATFGAGTFSGGANKVTFTAIQSGESANSITAAATAGALTGAFFENGADPVAASSNPIMNTTSNVGRVLENGAAIDSPVVAISLNMTNSLRTRFEVGNEGTDIPGSGDFQATGKIEVYFKTVTQLLAFFQHAARSLEFPLIDGLGNVRNVFEPRIKYKDGAPPIDGKNTDIVLPLDFQAMVDPTLGYTVQIDMLDA